MLPHFIQPSGYFVQDLWKCLVDRWGCRNFVL